MNTHWFTGKGPDFPLQSRSHDSTKCETFHVDRGFQQNTEDERTLQRWRYPSGLEAMTSRVCTQRLLIRVSTTERLYWIRCISFALRLKFAQKRGCLFSERIPFSTMQIRWPQALSTVLLQLRTFSIQACRQLCKTMKTLFVWEDNKQLSFTKDCTNSVNNMFSPVHCRKWEMTQCQSIKLSACTSVPACTSSFFSPVPWTLAPAFLSHFRFSTKMPELDAVCLSFPQPNWNPSCLHKYTQ